MISQTNINLLEEINNNQKQLEEENPNNSNNHKVIETRRWISSINYQLYNTLISLNPHYKNLKYQTLCNKPLGKENPYTNTNSHQPMKTITFIKHISIIDYVFACAQTKHLNKPIGKGKPIYQNQQIDSITTQKPI